MVKKYLKEHPDRIQLLKILYEEKGILPWDERVMRIHAHDIELFNIVNGADPDSTTTSDDDIPVDPILAKYELPKFDLPLFKEQDEKVKRLREEGKLFDKSPIGREHVLPASAIPNAPMTFDPLRGVGMPSGVKDGGMDG